ncbi:zinc finger CCCH domain-containing protein 14 isoform X2 [Orussus abietinus]|nr:zinc finger CCCH domain-containing protein 14 isoform X2 [Orussus abietinus]
MGIQNSESIQKKSLEKPTKGSSTSDTQLQDVPDNVRSERNHNVSQKTDTCIDESMDNVSPKTSCSLETPCNISAEAQIDTDTQEIVDSKHYSSCSNLKLTKQSKDSEAEDNIEGKRLKSCINKPRVTSVVSVKNRLGIISLRKKFEIHRDKSAINDCHRLPEKHFNRFSGRNRQNIHGRSFQEEDVASKFCEMAEKPTDIKSRLGNNRQEKSHKSTEVKDQFNTNVKMKSLGIPGATVKDRLGIGNNAKCSTLYANKNQCNSNFNPKIKHRLGPLKNNFKSTSNKGGFYKTPYGNEDSKCLNLNAEDEIDDNGESVVHGPIRSHIVAVKAPLKGLTRRKHPILPEKMGKGTLSDRDDKITDDNKLSSKVIVTPRPLKPLQPIQKRATQSLLLRAVAEANRSVVKQKNPEPLLMDKKPALKNLKNHMAWEIGQNLSVHLNSSKRFVMEKIQVELTTEESSDNKSDSYVPQGLPEEHMGVVMSLFQRTDDNQKFLVTLNGYNSNVLKDRSLCDEDERLEMEVNEDDEIALSSVQADSRVQEQQQSSDTLDMLNDRNEVCINDDALRYEENIENCNTENVDVDDEDVPTKKRKLSPIVYNRSRSQSPSDSKSISNRHLTDAKHLDPSLSIDTVIPALNDKSREKCRYWPNCTLGNKCAYYHPAVPCSLFPACKFGEKCVYKHPKCKFGLSCTKLGCIFSHPAQQCKYHPFCTKPACPFSHPPVQPPTHSGPSGQRTKFTWRRRG